MYEAEVDCDLRRGNLSIGWSSNNKKANQYDKKYRIGVEDGSIAIKIIYETVDVYVNGANVFTLPIAVRYYYISI